MNKNNIIIISTWKEEGLEFVISSSVGIKDPAAADEEAHRSIGGNGVGQGSEAMPPESHLLEFGAGDTSVADQPGRREKAQNNTY